MPELEIDANSFTTHAGRKKLARSLLGFCVTYLPHYFYLDPAEFHKELFREVENPENRFLEIIGFRGSAKSTIGSLALPLWAALEYHEQYPFILPVADTSLQSGLNIANIKNELDHNEILRRDYGKVGIGKPHDRSPEDPTFESEEEWQAKNMLLSNGVRILGRSRGQKVRGIRHFQHRPKLAIVDDAEDLRWVKTKENRDASERWLRGEVLPAMDESAGRCILIGNLLHMDALMNRMKRPPFKVLEYPLIKDGECMWPAKYPTQASLDQQRILSGEVGWQREYLLKVVPEEGQIIKEDDIQYYDAIPEKEFDAKGELIHNPLLTAGVGNDLAISKRETADYTTFVPAVMAQEREKEPVLYVVPEIINLRLDFKETIAWAKSVYTSISQKYVAPMFFTEDVAYQRAAIEMMQSAGIPVEGVKVGTDKRARLMLAAPFVKSGKVKFPKKGAEKLIAQLLGFGIEEHDDITDAFVHLVLGMWNQSGLQPMEVIVL